MIALYEEYQLFIISSLLFLCISTSIYCYVNYKKGKYIQLYFYGLVLLNIGLMITMIKILIGIGRVFFPIGALFGILGFVLIIIGAIKEQNKEKSISSK